MYKLYLDVHRVFSFSTGLYRIYQINISQH